MIRWNKLPSALMLAAVLVLAPACSAQTPELSVDAARELQSRLPEVRHAAAGNDYARALELLEQFKTDLDEAAGDGKMSFARYQGISGALDRVRTELQTLAAAAMEAATPTDVASPAPGPAPADVPDVGPAPLQPVPAPVPPVSEEPGGPGKENPGKGTPGKTGPDGKNKNL